MQARVPSKKPFLKVLHKLWIGWVTTHMLVPFNQQSVVLVCKSCPTWLRLCLTRVKVIFDNKSIKTLCWSEAEEGWQFIVKGKVVKADGPIGITLEKFHVVALPILVVNWRQGSQSPPLVSAHFRVVMGHARVHEETLNKLLLGVTCVLGRGDLRQPSLLD